MRIRSLWLKKLVCRLGVSLLRLNGWTCRFHQICDPAVSVYQNPPECLLYSTWHEDIVLTLLTRRPAGNAAGLVSKHGDGDWVVEILKAVGVKPVRGSSSRGAAKALREMLDVVEDHHLCITSDGPRGPRRKVKAGLIFLAAKTGRPIVPAAYACARTWTIRGNWTDMKIPRPFTNVYLVGGDPVHVPPDLDREGVAHYTDVLQRAMDEVTERAEAYARGEKPDAPATPATVDSTRVAA